METTERPGRPWAEGFGLLVLGLAVSAIANALGLQGEPGPLLRTIGWAGYVLGLVVAGAGIHRILWVGPSQRKRWSRLLVTALVTLPAFFALALVLSLIFTIFQIRFRY